MTRLAGVAYLVDDYDRAIDWFRHALRFRLIEDTPLDSSKRWVVVEPPGGGSRLILMRPVREEQRAVIGRQAGGRVFLFLETDDFTAEHARMCAAGVRFREPPREERYGTVAVFEDLYGQPWDLIEPKP